MEHFRLDALSRHGKQSRAVVPGRLAVFPVFGRGKCALCGSCCRGSRPLRSVMAAGLGKDGRAHSNPPVKGHQAMPPRHLSTATASTSCCLHSTAVPAKERQASNVQKFLGKIGDQITFK